MWNPDIQIITLVVYTGADAAALQISGLLASSERALKLIGENPVPVKAIVDATHIKFRWVVLAFDMAFNINNLSNSNQQTDAAIEELAGTKKAAATDAAADDDGAAIRKDFRKSVTKTKRAERMENDKMTKADFRELTKSNLLASISKFWSIWVSDLVLMCLAELVHPKFDMAYFTWSTATKLAYRLQMTLVGWPINFVPNYPHDTMFKADQTTLPKWQLLAELTTKNILKFVSWTDGTFWSV